MNLEYIAVIVKLLKMPLNIRKACSEIKTKMNYKHVILTTKNKIFKTVIFTPHKILPINSHPRQGSN